MSHDRPLRSVTGRDIPRERRCDLKVLAHAAAIIGLYLAFSFALFLGLQVSPVPVRSKYSCGFPIFDVGVDPGKM